MRALLSSHWSDGWVYLMTNLHSPSCSVLLHHQLFGEMSDSLAAKYSLMFNSYLLTVSVCCLVLGRWLSGFIRTYRQKTATSCWQWWEHWVWMRQQMCLKTKTMEVKSCAIWSKINLQKINNWHSKSRLLGDIEKAWSTFTAGSIIYLAHSHSIYVSL